MKQLLSTLWLILYLTAMLGAALVIVICPARWFFSGCVNLDEFAFWFIIVILFISIFVQAKNGGTLELFEGTKIFPLAMILVCILCSCSEQQPKSDLQGLIQQVDERNDAIQKYEWYYYAVERMLDSLKVTEDNAILDTDAGQEYLYYKDKVDSVMMYEYGSN